jgi:hypothetical protein
MRSATVTTVLDAPAAAVFDYLSKIENLPGWADEFARELRWEGDEAFVRNGGLGEFVFRIAADERTGVIDMLAGPSADELAIFPTRVVALPGPRSAFTFTMFQQPGVPDELFEAQRASLVRELENVRSRFATQEPKAEARS